jgi:signal transduction histidine kinase
MRFPDRLIPRSITTQITGIVTISVLIGMVLTATATFVITGGPSSRDRPVVRIAQIAELAQAAETPADVAVIIATARRAGVQVAQVPPGEFETLPRADLPGLPELEAREPGLDRGNDVIEVVRHPGQGGRQLAVRISDGSALVFEAPRRPNLWHFILGPTALTSITLLVVVLLLSVYAVRWIIAPLSAVAAATQSFGRFPDQDQAVRRKGPREIVRVADALNEMRTRIRALLDDRMRMLAAISHDLRTPLTRLRLRTERVADRRLRDAMLNDIGRVSRMLDETLDYLRQDGRSECMSRADLPSLLQTVCSDFADVGHAVSYSGPGRLTWTCRPSALTRAVTNVVENGVKHGSSVTVALALGADGAAEIEVSDDGPGIQAELRDRVFEPFFKTDDARATGDGFGLGLSIARDVVKGHGGDISLLERHPAGLTVRITLPAPASSMEAHGSGQPKADRPAATAAVLTLFGAPAHESFLDQLRRRLGLARGIAGRALPVRPEARR